MLNMKRFPNFKPKTAFEENSNFSLKKVLAKKLLLIIQFRHSALKYYRRKYVSDYIKMLTNKKIAHQCLTLFYNKMN